MTAHDAQTSPSLGVPTRLSWILAVVSGLALYAAHAPLGVRASAFVAPAALVAGVLLSPGGPRRAAALGGTAYLLAHVAMLTWLVPAAGVVAWVLLSAVQGAWGALLGVLLHRARRWPVALAPLSALAWVGIDAWRGTVPLGGFAWGTLASAQVGDVWLRPLLRLGGEHLMTFAIALLGAGAAQMLVGVVREATREGRPDVDAWIRAFPAGQVGVTWLVGTAVAATLATVEPPAQVGEADVLAVQPWDREDVDGTRAWDRQVARQALELTRTAVESDGVPDLTIWPETTVNHEPSADPELLATLAEAGRLAEGGLVAGVKRDGPDPAATWFNTATVVDGDGELGDAYRKRRPVPFGEYVPFRDALDWFPALGQVPRDMLRGDGPQQLVVGDLSVAVAICFESLFPEVVRSNVLAGERPADLVVVSTYDGSFGRVGQAEQHLQQSRLRAVETGRWVVHAGASGLTAFVSPEGDVEQVSDLFTATTRRRTVPLVEGRTPFLVTGDWVGLLARVAVAFAVLIGTGATLWRRRSSTDLPSSPPDPGTTP